ncbi:MAG: DUF1566 domain-containing protein [Deltaproteobacteria bacterium]|nr:DUF1566 domain-containing protein [Deltaproteobacteria bacterium]
MNKSYLWSLSVVFLMMLVPGCGDNSKSLEGKVVDGKGRSLASVAEKRNPIVNEAGPAPSTVKEIGRDGRFIAYDNGTVLDTGSGLMWAATDNGYDMDWKGAKSYCENFGGGGYTDWRLPTQDELAGLYDPAITYKTNCGFSAQLTKLIRLTCTTPWASETRGRDAACFRFLSGTRYWSPQASGDTNRALPVRFGK